MNSQGLSRSGRTGEDSTGGEEDGDRSHAPTPCVPCRNREHETELFPPADRKFTGQRLDDTGLYYYGARYYDAGIGRFISPDPTIPEATNPQAFNRYSYCINNPTSAIDPSGLDYIFVCGSGGDRSQWNAIVKALDIDSRERVTFIEDPYPNGWLDFSRWEVTDQYDALVNELATGGYTDIKIIGFSEGACATAMVLDQLANNGEFLGGTDVRDELTAAIMLEAPTWPSPIVHGNNPRVLIDLPSEVHAVPGMRDVILADIWNEASIAHQNTPLPGWEDYSFMYDSRGWLGAFDPSTWFDYWSVREILLSGPYYHGDVLKNGQVLEQMKGLLGTQ